MLKERTLSFVLPLMTVLLAAWIIMGFNGQQVAATPGRITEGSLLILGPEGKINPVPARSSTPTSRPKSRAFWRESPSHRNSGTLRRRSKRSTPFRCPRRRR